MSNVFKSSLVPSGGGNTIDYSTSEQDTGMKWIDGKKIYQKTIDFGALPNNTSKTVAHGISNIDYIIDMIMVCKNSTDSSFIKLYDQNSAGTNKRRMTVDGTNINVSTTADSSTMTGYVTLKYTKTS